MDSYFKWSIQNLEFANQYLNLSCVKTIFINKTVSVYKKIRDFKHPTWKKCSQVASYFESEAALGTCILASWISSDRRVRGEGRGVRVGDGEDDTSLRSIAFIDKREYYTFKG